MPDPQRRTAPREQDFFEKVLAGFAERFGTPSEDLPTVRCVSRPVLIRTLNRIRDQLAVPGFRRVPARTILRHLAGSALVHPLYVADPDTGERVDRFYVVGLGAGESSVEPAELLMALDPRGVVCYFSALQFHSLTTQLPSHHHVARLTDWGARSTSAATGSLSATSERSFDPLGTEQFVHESVSYYTTARDRGLVPGVQLRYLSDRSMVRITTLEQTLLDTLHRPLSCGGPAVVLEAWGTGLDSLNESRLAGYLERIGDPALVRRVGFLLQDLQHDAGGPLGALLRSAAEAVAGAAPPEVIPLFQGYAGAVVDHTWRVERP